jgi:hypothetical protein
MQIQFQSSVGCVVDVATPSKRKLRALGVLWVLIALLPLALINYLIIQFLTSPDPLITSKPLPFLGALLMPVLLWHSLGSAVQRFRAAATDDRYLRSGPGGISVCLPNDNLRSTFLFSLATLEFDLPWDRIKTWYPFVQKTNGIPTERTIIFETLKGEKIKINTYHFAEKPDQIVANITRSKSIVLEDEDSPASTAQPRIGDPAFQYKKKKDRIKEIDLTGMVKGQRAACVERIADMLQARIMSQAAGFRCSRKRYRPFKEWQDVFGIRLFVRRGLLSGYEIQIEPNDSESRRLTISMCPSSLMSDIGRYFSIGVGGLLFLILFTRMHTVEYWLDDFADLAPVVVVVVCVGVAALSLGLLGLFARLLRLLFANNDGEEAQKHGIRVGIKEMTI